MNYELRRKEVESRIDISDYNNLLSTCLLSFLSKKSKKSKLKGVNRKS